MSSSTSTSLSPPPGLAPVEGLPVAAHAVPHRELFPIHSSLQLIFTILRGPWDTLAPALADTVACPRLLAHLRGLDASIDQIKRATYTLVYTDQLFNALGLLHLTHFDRGHTRLTAQLRDQTTSLDTPVSPPSPSSLLPRLIYASGLLTPLRHAFAIGFDLTSLDALTPDMSSASLPKFPLAYFSPQPISRTQYGQMSGTT